MGKVSRFPARANRAEAADAGGYTPPASPYAEQSVLGAILVKPEGLDLVRDMLVKADFYREAHGQIYQAMVDLYDQDKPVDLVTVTQVLNNRGKLEQVGGPVFLAGLSEQVGFATNIEYYAEMVRDKAVLRRLLDCTQQIAAACLAPVENVPEFLDEAEAKIFKIAEDRTPLRLTPLGEIAAAENLAIEQQWESVRPVGVRSGFYDLDQMTAGFQPSDLFILAGRPSMGKTGLALNIAYNVAKRDHEPVALFSLEMSKGQLMRRQFAAMTRIDGEILKTGKLRGEEWARLGQAVADLEDIPVLIDDRPAATFNEIKAACRRQAIRGGLRLIIVDYLQLVVWDGKAGNREQEVARISAGFKKLARELKIPVILLAQLSRDCEKRPDKRPFLSDLRESGAIEQDGDVVMFLYRDEVYNENTPQKGVCECLIRKQRNGPTGKFLLNFAEKFTLFSNHEKDPGLF